MIHEPPQHPPRTPSDDAVDRAMDRYADGDDAAFAVVYDGIAPALYRNLGPLVPNDILLEELVEQVFVSIHRSRGSFINGSTVLPWALALATRLLARSDQRRVLVFDDRLHRAR